MAAAIVSLTAPGEGAYFIAPWIMLWTILMQLRNGMLISEIRE